MSEPDDRKSSESTENGPPKSNFRAARDFETGLVLSSKSFGGNGESDRRSGLDSRTVGLDSSRIEDLEDIDRFNGDITQGLDSITVTAGLDSSTIEDTDRFRAATLEPI